MIMGHIPFEKEIVRLIYVFHMPLFFIVSGFLYKKSDNLKMAIWKWIKRLIVPYFIFAALGYTLWFIEAKPMTFNQFVQPLKSVLWINTDGMPINGAIWYLTATFLVFLLYWCIDFYINNLFYKNVLIMTLMIVGLLFGRLKIVLPFSGSVAMVGIGFFYSGILFKRYYPYLLRKFNESKNLKWKLVTCGVILAFMGYNNGYVSMRTGNYGNSAIVFYLSAVVITGVMLCASQFTINNFSESTVVKWLKVAGRNSIVYLGLNELVINIIGSIVDKFVESICIYKLLTFVFSCLILSIIVEILKQSKCMKRLFSLS